jgi:hypothetical protein
MDLEATLSNTVIQTEEPQQPLQQPLNKDQTVKTVDLAEPIVEYNESINVTEARNTEQPMILDISERGGLIYDLIHTFDDLYVYSRTIIENNYFNFASNEDFNMVYPGIYIGNYSTSTNFDLLKKLGITNIISVIPSFNPPFADKFQYYHIPAYDDESQDLSIHFKKSDQYIYDVLQNRGKVFIHCMVGRSRSVTIFVSFLINLIKSGFNQDNIDLDLDNMESNEIDYRRFGNQALGVTADGMSSKIGVENRNVEENDFIGVSKIKYDRPQFGDKVKNFIRYKKEGMISEVEELRCKYNLLDIEIREFSQGGDDGTTKKLKDTLKNNLMVQIFKYVRKYRKQAAPNEYFIDQLINLL